MLLELADVCKSFGADTILEGVGLSLAAGDRVGLLGANGAGKSTLLSIMSGELDCDAGSVSRARDARVGYLRQHGALDPGNTIQAEISSVFDDVHALGARLEQARARLAEGGSGHARLLAEYDEMNAAFEARDGYALDVKIDMVLGGMGFSGYDRDMPIATLSGGEKTRLAIAKLLLSRADLLILDEPTNHLDFATLEWLEAYLRAWRGALVVVSHDRYFLDNVVTGICELERHHLTRYPGGYSRFVLLKQERAGLLRKQYERQQEEIHKLEDYVARNLTRASTSNMAKSRLHMLERIERIERPPGEGRSTRLRFSIDTEPYKDVLVTEGVSVSVGEGAGRKLLCETIDLHLLRGEKVALIGLNGVGKSSLLKALMGQISCEGHVKWGANVRISYFEQENRQLDWEHTVIGELNARFPRKTEPELRTLLGSLLLSGDDIYKKIGSLSGGERAKVAFAMIILERANVLILDEPTNHLDYKTKEVLEDALITYPGTILMVSHDRYLLNRVPTRILEMFPGRLRNFDGGYDYYVAHRENTREAPPPKKPAADTPYHRSKARRSIAAQRKSRAAMLETEILGLETRIAALEREAASPDTASDYQKLEECCRQLEESRDLLAQKTDEWLLLMEEDDENA